MIKTRTLSIVLTVLLTGFSSAYAAGLVIDGVAAPQNQVNAAGSSSAIKPFAASGQGTNENLAAAACGTGVVAGLKCPGSDTCECVESRGTFKATSLGTGNFDLVLSLDLTTAANNGSQENFPTSGILILAGKSSTVRLNTIGLAAIAPAPGASPTPPVTAVYTGSFGVMSGTGKFASVQGSGTLSWTHQYSPVAGFITVTGTLN